MCELAEGLVRADGVVDDSPGLELAVEGMDVERRVLDLVKLLGVGALSTLDATVEFGRTGWQDEETDSPLLTLTLELGGEFTSSIDLEGPYGEGYPGLTGIDEPRGGSGVSLLPFQVFVRRRCAPPGTFDPRAELHLRPTLNALAEWILRIELLLPRAGLSLPAGGSLMAGTRRPC